MKFNDLEIGKYCKENEEQDMIAGFVTTTWVFTQEANREKILEAIELLSTAIREYFEKIRGEKVL